MKRLIVIACLAIAGAPVHASPTLPAPAAPSAQIAVIPFDPPLDAPLRYRWEKAVQRDGKTRMSWAVSDFRFEEQGDGFRLTVSPVGSGSNETDPARLAM